MRITVVGVGYVGLVTGTCFAESGNEVTCVDIDAARIERLKRGVLPIYEPGLDEMVRRNCADGRLHFSTDLAAALQDSSVAFIAVGTPQSDTGASDLSALWAVARSIRTQATHGLLVVIKSTVPVGTNRELETRLNRGAPFLFETASNPEFLKEGHAVEDFLRPDRVVVGVRTPEATRLLHTLYAPFLRNGRPFLVMSPESAEMSKYVANAMLATKISFINEMANFCEQCGADINDVRQGIGHDSRIGFQFLFPGAGYGGSCFPKDVRSLIAQMEKTGQPSTLLHAVDEVNEQQKYVLLAKVKEQLGGNLNNRSVAVWGLAFKPNTDDIREAPALVLVRGLLAAGAKVRVYDPKAMDNVREQLGDTVEYALNATAALKGCDALVIATEWPEFRNPDFEVVRRSLRQPCIIDGRNLYDPDQMARLGFVYSGIGQRKVAVERAAQAA